MRERLIYSRYSDNRNKRYAIATNIYRGANGKRVEKEALYPEGESHIRNIPGFYEELSDLFRDSAIRIQRAEYKDRKCIFEYIEGKTLEEELDDLLEEGEYEGAFSKIREYFDILRKHCSGQAFRKTEAFTTIFGDEDFPDGTCCASINNIDYGFGNIILSDDGMWLIDYEWCFRFPIPIDFILFRALLYFVYTNPNGRELADRGVFQKFGYEESLIEKYRGMEHKLQRYIAEDVISIADLKEDMLQKTLHIHELYTGRDKKITELNGTIEQKENYIGEQREMLSERDRKIMELNGIIEQKENYIGEQREMLSEREDYIQRIARTLYDPQTAPKEEKQKLLGYVPDFLSKGIVRKLFQTYSGIRMKKDVH